MFFSRHGKSKDDRDDSVDSMALNGPRHSLRIAAVGSTGLAVVLRAAMLLASGLIAGCAAVYEPGITVQPPVHVLGPTESLTSGITASVPIHHGNLLLR